MTPEEQGEFGDSIIQTQIAISRAVSEAETWEDADQRVRREISRVSQTDSDFKAYRMVWAETLAGSHMLSRAFQTGRASEAPLEDIAFYTDMLIRNDSPEASLVAQALDALGETWSAQRIQSAAAETIRAADRFDARKATRSVDPRVENLEAAADRNAGRGSARDETQAAAVRRLEAIATD